MILTQDSQKAFARWSPSAGTGESRTRHTHLG